MSPIQTSISSRWHPLIEERTAAPVRRVVDEITGVLADSLDRHKSAALQHGLPSPFHLAEGAAGIAIYFSYLTAAGFFPEARKYAIEYLNIAIESLASAVMVPGLYSGFAGIAWAAQHVAKVLGEPGDDLSEIDAAVEQYLRHSPWKDDYDLITGLVGLGVYCLERTESPPARGNLERIVELLDQLAEHGDGEVRWFTVPEMLIEQQRKEFPQGYYNLGVAHGAPGAVALLAKIHAAGIAQEKARSLLAGAVRWIWKQRLSPSYQSWFSSFAVPGKEPDDCRLAWCYGDPGISAAFMIAARLTDNPSLEASALQIAQHAAGRRTDTGARDVCFCHGSAGLAHIFNRFYQSTGDESFAEAARYWLNASLELRRPGIGAAGYQVWTANENGVVVQAERLGLIEGIAGVGLAMLGAITNIEPAWDRMFLTDIPLRVSANG